MERFSIVNCYIWQGGKTKKGDRTIIERRIMHGIKAATGGIL